MVVSGSSGMLGPFSIGGPEDADPETVLQNQSVAAGQAGVHRHTAGNRRWDVRGMPAGAWADRTP